MWFFWVGVIYGKVREKSILDRGVSICKGFEVELNLVIFKNIKEVVKI